MSWADTLAAGDGDGGLVCGHVADHHTPEVGVDVQAFVVTRPSVKKIEEAWDVRWEGCRVWANNNRLEYAPHKTTAIFAPTRSLMREPRRRMEEVIIEPQFSMKYLGRKGSTRQDKSGRGGASNPGGCRKEVGSQACNTDGNLPSGDQPGATVWG